MQQDFEQFAGEIERSLNKDIPWPEPMPFTGEQECPFFPTECLPAPLMAMVENLAESSQTPEEMSGALALIVLSTAFQKRYTVEVTPDWTEPLCLYVAAVALPGERKSAVINALTKPIYQYEAQQNELDSVEIAKNRTERELLEASLQAAKAAAAKGKCSRQDVLSISEELSQFQDIHPLRLVADDTTAEKLIDLMDKQGGCMSIISAEGGVFDAMKGRYDQGANFDVYLKGHAGDPLIVDRVGRSGNRIESPRLSMALTVQPEVLSGLLGNSSFRGRGLCGRFLYVLCNSKVGHRKSAPEPIPTEIKNQYQSFVRDILAGQGKGVGVSRNTRTCYH